MVDPLPRSRLLGPTVTFIWTDNGAPVTEWWLYVGSGLGAQDLQNSGSLGSARSMAVSGLPTDGSGVYVRLWFNIGGDWRFVDMTYDAANP